MKVQLISVGTQMPSWVKEGYSEYAKRLTQDILLELVEIETKKRGKNANIPQIQRFEEKQLLAEAKKCDLVIALDPKGKPWSTEQLSQRFQDWQNLGHHRIGLLVGGPEGLTDACRQQADLLWSLSPLTFPHPLVRVIVAEQIYRAWTITKSHPYHR